jgi:hypothetical protein
MLLYFTFKKSFTVLLILWSIIPIDLHSKIRYTSSRNTLYSNLAESMGDIDTSKWYTYFGGHGNESLRGFAIDSKGNICIVGTTTSSSNITNANSPHQSNHGGGEFDAFVVKYNPQGDILWSSYFGGSKHDYGSGIAIDSKDNIIITGQTYSENQLSFNSMHQQKLNGYSDAFIAKFNSNGVLIWSTYYGAEEGETCSNVSCDKNDNLFIAGITSSSSNNLATAGSHQPKFGGRELDGFLAKFNPKGELIWSSYFGGDYNEMCRNIHIDSKGNIIIIGNTESKNNIATTNGEKQFNNHNDAFIAKFNNDGMIIWSTYFGGDSNDDGVDLCTDSNNNIYIIGTTESINELSKNALHQSEYGGGRHDCFVSKLNEDGNTLWCSYLGGDKADLGLAITVDEYNHVIVTGKTFSKNNISLSYSWMDTLNYSDGFLNVFDNKGYMLWGSYIGGSVETIGRDVKYFNKTYYLIGETKSELSINNHNFIEKEKFYQNMDGFIISFNFNIPNQNSIIINVSNNVYPNPIFNKGILKLNVETTNNNFEIINSTGNKILSGDFIGKSTEVNVESMNPGIYYVIINKTIKEKLIIF